MRFNLPKIDDTEVKSREGLYVRIDKSPDRNTGYYAAVYNKFGHQVSNTEFSYRKRNLKNMTIEDFTLHEV
jgi:hypothetical protein